MTGGSRQAGVVAVLLFSGAATVWLAATGARPRMFEVGFWFEPVAFEASRLGPPLDAGDLATIAAVARSELAEAFTGLRVQVSDRRDARYRISVVQDLFDPRVRRKVSIAGASVGISGYGGSGSVNFLLLASNAVAFAPPGAGRDAILTAIGKGVGRTAAHELAHQFMPTVPFDHSRDVRSYEYGIANRSEHYYDTLRWDIAWPMLVKRLGPLPQTATAQR